MRRLIGWCNTRSKASLWIPSTWAARWAERRFSGSAASEKTPGLWAGPPSSAADDELAWLQAAFAGVQAERRSRVVTVLGEAGVGKSRLAREFAASTGELPLVGRCVSYGDGATFLPLAQIVRKAVPERPRAAILALLEGDDQAPLVAERVTHLTEPADGAASTGEVFWAVRRFLEALARERPVVVLLEDIHWAEPTFLDLIEYLDSWPAEAALLVLCLARRELLEERPGWGSRNGVLALEPLAEGEAGVLVEEVAAESLDEETRTQIVRIAAGNPLFLEQLLAFLQEAGPSALVSVPPTVEALLAGRLERLDPAERALTERAAVAGRDFSRGGLLALSPPEELAGLDSRLMALVRRGLVRAVRGGDDDTYRFHHVLVRDVAYAGTTKDARAELHERFGTWLEQRGKAADEIVGYHLEQAHRYRKELRPGDPGVVGLAQRAGRVLAAAGIGAWKRADAEGGDEPPRPRCVVAPCRRAQTGGDSLRARDEPRASLVTRPLLTPRSFEAIDEAVAAGDHVSAAWAGIELARARLHRGGDPDELVALVQDAMPLFEEARNERALARAWRALGYARGSMQGRCADWLDASERALPYYRQIRVVHGRLPVRDRVRAVQRSHAGTGGDGEVRAPARGGDGSSRTGPRPRIISPVSTPTTGAETRPFGSSMKRTTCTATSGTTTAWPTRAAGSAVASTP